MNPFSEFPGDPARAKAKFSSFSLLGIHSACRSGLAAVAVAAGMMMVPARTQAFDDFGTWQWLSLEAWHHGKFTGTLFNEARWRDDSSEFSLFLCGPLVRHQTWSHTSFAAGLYALHTPRGYELDDTNQYWIDLEMLNTWKASDSISFSMRTMPEHRWLDDPEDDKQFSRHRFAASWAPQNLGALKKVYINTELFLDWENGDIPENRFIPCGMTFQLREKLLLDIFPMIRSIDRPSGWTNDFILGTHVIWKL